MPQSGSARKLVRFSGRSNLGVANGSSQTASSEKSTSGSSWMSEWHQVERPPQW